MGVKSNGNTRNNSKKEIGDDIEIRMASVYHCSISVYV